LQKLSAAGKNLPTGAETSGRKIPPSGADSTGGLFEPTFSYWTNGRLGLQFTVYSAEVATVGSASMEAKPQAKISRKQE